MYFPVCWILNNTKTELPNQFEEEETGLEKVKTALSSRKPEKKIKTKRTNKHAK